jgi:divinyl protochlorophyllide a 8-vinyl-reductase
VGPNAVTRVGEALDTLYGRATTYAVFADAGLTGYLDAWPQDMVDEAEVAQLNRALHDHLPESSFRQVARDAGRRTGDYLLAYRIPKPVQAVLRPAPAWLAGRVLLKAIARNAWTFAGSGAFDAAAGRPFAVTIADCPLCREIRADHPVCDTYTATFERLFRVLVHPHAEASETACQAVGAHACRFEISW